LFLRPQIALMMGAAKTPETLANIYRITRRYNPEDSHLQNTSTLFMKINILWYIDKANYMRLKKTG
jgi:hypothetical protein